MEERANAGNTPDAFACPEEALPATNLERGALNPDQHQKVVAKWRLTNKANPEIDGLQYPQFQVLDCKPRENRRAPKMCFVSAIMSS